MVAAENVTFSTTAECNYHVLKSSTRLHLHPPLFFPCSGGFFWAKITLGNTCVALQWKVSSTAGPLFMQMYSILVQELSELDWTGVHNECINQSKFRLVWCFSAAPKIHCHTSAGCRSFKTAWVSTRLSLISYQLGFTAMIPAKGLKGATVQVQGAHSKI